MAQTHIKTTLAFMGMLASVGCGKDEPQVEGLVQRSDSKVYLLSNNAPGAESPGAFSEVTRFADRIGASVTLKEATPLTTVQLWALVFNNPDACTTKSAVARCGIADLDNAAANAGMHFAGEGLVQANGDVRLSTTIVVGDTSRTKSGAPLEDAAKADVHLMVRNMGAINLTALRDQLTKYDACNGTCIDYAIAAHEANKTTGWGEAMLETAVYFVDSNKDGVNDSKLGQAGLMASPNAKAILIRTPEGIDATMTVYGVPGANVYSAWFVIFNNWDACKDKGEVGEVQPRCQAGDQQNADVKTGIIGPLAAGVSLMPDGSLHASARLLERDITSIPSEQNEGLTRPMYADIHVTLRGHGPIQTNTATDAVAQFSDFRACYPKCGGLTTAPNEFATAPQPEGLSH